MGSNRFSKLHAHLNLGPNIMFGSSCSLDFELNFGQVQRSTGLNPGSEPNYGSIIWTMDHYMWTRDTTLQDTQTPLQLAVT